MNINLSLIKEERATNFWNAFERAMQTDPFGDSFNARLRRAIENDKSCFSISLLRFQFKSATREIDLPLLEEAFNMAQKQTPVHLVGLSVENYTSVYDSSKHSNLRFHIKEPGMVANLFDKLWGCRRVI